MNLSPAGKPWKTVIPTGGLRKLPIYPLDLLLRLRAASRGINSGISVWPGAMHAPSARQTSSGGEHRCGSQLPWVSRQEGRGGMVGRSAGLWKHLLCRHPPLWRNLCLSANSQGRAPDWSLSSQWAGWY